MVNQRVGEESDALRLVVVQEDGVVALPHVISLGIRVKQAATLYLHLSVVDEPMRVYHDKAGLLGVLHCSELLRKSKCILNYSSTQGKLCLLDNLKDVL